MFIKPPQQRIPTRSISNASGHSNNLRYSAIPSPQSNTLNAIWDINQIGQELDCHDDPMLNEALEMIQNKQVNQAILILNQMVSDGKKYLGQQSQVQQITKITLLVVSSAMSILENDPASALLLLLGCDQMFKGLTGKQQGYLRVQILNGLGCYYRRVGQMDKALKELECALAVIRKYGLKEVAVTHLNLSVVLSLIEEHEGALENAKKAVTESHKEYQYYIKNHVSMSQFKFQRCVSSLAISFYNVGVQEQHFQRYQFALQAYASAFKVAEDNLGVHNYLTIQLKNIYEEYARQLAIAEAQKIAITSLNHKFQIKANVSSQYAQSVLRSQQMDTTTKKVTDRLFQSESKRLTQHLRPQSAVSLQQQKLKTIEITKKEGFTIKKQMSATNRTINQISEENQKETEGIEKNELTKKLKEDIENLKTLAFEEQQQLKRIQEQKQRELQKLEAFRYINQQIQQQKKLKNTPQTSREMKSSIDKMRDIINTDPQIQDQLDESEPQPLVAVSGGNNREVRTEEEEEKVISQQKIGRTEKSEQQIDKTELKRVSLTTTQEQKNFQDETNQSSIKHYDQEQDSQQKCNQVYNMSCKQIDDIEEISEEPIEVNQQIIETQVDQIISEKAEQLEEDQKINSIKCIQNQWRQQKERFKKRIKKIQEQYMQVYDPKFIKLQDEYKKHHKGYLIIGWSQNNIDFVFIDTEIVKKSSRKSSDQQKILKHISQLSFTSLISFTNDLADQISDEIMAFLAIKNEALSINSIDSHIQFKQKNNEHQIVCEFQSFKIEYLTIEETRQFQNTPVTMGDILQFNSESLIMNKAAHIGTDINAQQVGAFTDVPIIKSEEGDSKQKINSKQSLQYDQQENYMEEQFENDEIEKVNQTGQFNTQQQSSQAQLSSLGQHSQQDIEKNEEHQQEEHSGKLNQGENNQNLDFTLQMNENSINSITNSQNLGEVEAQAKQSNMILNSTGNIQKEKISVNNTIIEEDEEEKKDQEDMEQDQRNQQEKIQINQINDSNNQQKSEQKDETVSLKHQSSIKDSVQSQSHETHSQHSRSHSLQSHQSEEDLPPNQLLVPPTQANYQKQPSIQLPDLMKDDMSQNSDQDVSLNKPYTYEKIGAMTGLNKNDGTLIQINLFINREQQMFQAKAEDFKVKPTYFKVENIEKTIKKPQKYLKGYIVNWNNENILKVYTKAHEKAVLKLQKKFKFDHYRRHITFKLPKSNIEGGLYVGSRKQVIFLAIETKNSHQRNSYTFKNENYSQFVHRISFRVLNNLKYAEDKGIYLLQEPLHRILAQNLQAKIFKLDKPQNAFEFVGFGLLNGIYDSVHKKIIIASDNRKTQAAQVDVLKSITGNEQLSAFAQNLLDRSFIIQTNSESCVVYYEEKDEDNVKVIQKKVFTFQTVRILIINYTTATYGRLIEKKITVELQRRLRREFALKCENQLFKIGKLDDQQTKTLLINFKKLVTIYLNYHDTGEIEFEVDAIKEFLNNGQYANLLRMDLKDFISNC